MTDLKELIERELASFLEWPSDHKGSVTTTSAKLFAEHVAQLYADHIRDAAKMVVPAVQGEPVAWVTAGTVDGQAVNGKPRRIWWENNEGVGMPIYAAPQPAEHQPAPDVARLVEALEAALGSFDDWCEGQDPSDIADALDTFPWVRQARAALAARRKQEGN